MALDRVLSASGTGTTEKLMWAGATVVPSEFLGLSDKIWALGNAEVPTFPWHFRRTHQYLTGPASGVLAWDQINPAQGQFTWTNFDTYVNEAYAASRKVIYCVVRTPGWSQVSPDPTKPPDNMTWVTALISSLCGRYNTGGILKVPFIEVWNEADASGFWSGTMAELVEVAKAIYQMAKAVDSNIKIIGPSFVSSGYSKLTEFLTTAAPSGGGAGADFIDAVSIHIYDSYTYAGYDRSGYSVSRKISDVKAAMAAGGLAANYPWYNTEMGHQPPWTGATVNPYILRIGQPERAKEICRSMLLQIANGAQGCVLYGWDGGLNGEWRDGHANPALQTEFARMVGFLSGATLTSIYRTSQGKFIMTKSGGQQLCM